MSHLFQPLRLKDVRLRNRIGVPPMCMYMAEDGMARDRHRTHYGSLALGGAGLVTVEATAVSPEGRITDGCLGLWKDSQTAALASVAKAIRSAGAVPGIQLAHAGRKASARKPWDGDDHIPEGDPAGWTPISPSAIPFGAHLGRTPAEMDGSDILRVQQAFADAATRARDAGFEWLELHFGHGYLGQSFLSFHANQRDDAWGGSLDNRSRFLLDTLRGVRKVWPESLPLTARLGAVEFDGRDEQTLGESIEVARAMKAEGLDLLSVSLGFSTPNADIPWGKPAFLAPVAERIRREVQIPVSSAWGFEQPQIAEEAVAQGQLDLALVGRSHLANPHWTYWAAKTLGIPEPGSLLPTQYAYWLDRYQPTASAT
ncbi:NADH:flavin oxidoreductase/NADH oxidase (plasmid) [Rhizobium sp. CB3060]|uniref:NADH:flavin oxidoreductase/NADH oxidase n=1 Tax=Rhizobium sp. CB3060 TaxID=3138255 RepID=UPI0021A7E83F|nr:NADH:flavin oxidoreductase/NADH oxidase [Rhizobium tropici]UWU26187.1 NADH:flavin oxidoreductase/NADH oxidase [Rhizobium tropici]